MLKIFILIYKYKKNLFWLSIMISMVLLFMPGGTQPGIPYFDKVAHFLLFAWLCFLGTKTYQNYFIVISSLVVYTILAEFIQYFFIPNRGLELMDSIVGIIGIFVSWLLFISLRRPDFAIVTHGYDG